ncbi:MAG: universal stress protein [Phycisphaerae bacterium]|nr:universal stress protein [Phycisphaerae bacterium]
MSGATPYSSIVVGTDFTPCSTAALARALRIAGSAEAKVHVVHVIDTVVVIELESVLSPLQLDIRENLISSARGAWTEFARSIPGAADLPIEISINNRIAGILRHARDHSADLLVVGAFGDRPPDVGLGTVASACVRRSRTDVLLERSTIERRGSDPFKVIVAAVDFSQTSLRAIERAARLASHDGAELHIVHVSQKPWRQFHYRTPTPLVPARLEATYRSGLDARLAEFARPALEHHPALSPKLAVFDHSGHRSGIVEFADRVKADLIVLGTRGRSNLRDVLLGSTAEKALSDSRCSILAVKAENAAQPPTEEEEPRVAPMQPMF